MATAIARVAFEEASKEAHALVAKAEEAIEEGVYAAKRTMRTAQRRAEDAVNDAAGCVRKQPLTAVSATLGAGIAIGVAGALLATAMYSWWAERRR
jgi:ElaB/YqjD/DUF883 family membrane-anchored ribosome-binding protein